jgi:hypothetical protein
MDEEAVVFGYVILKDCVFTSRLGGIWRGAKLSGAPFLARSLREKWGFFGEKKYALVDITEICPF